MEFECPTTLVLLAKFGENIYEVDSPAVGCQSLQSCNFDHNLECIWKRAVQLASTEDFTTCMLYVYGCYYYHQFIGKTPGLENINIEILS